MKLSKNAWHAKLNRFTYGRHYLSGVDCLCPYFWGTLLAITILPFYLMGKGFAKMINAIPNVELPEVSDSTKDKVSLILGYMGLFLFVFFVTISLGLGVINLGIITMLLIIGAVTGVVLGLIGLVLLGYYIKEKYDDWRWDHPKENKPNLFIEFVKAKKNKHCPLIFWE